MIREKTLGVKRHIVLILLETCLLFLGTKTSPVFAKNYNPVSVLSADVLPISSVRKITMPPLDNKRLKTREPAQPLGGPIQFAEPIPTNDLDILSKATSETLKNGISIFRLRIASTGALSINLGFSNYFMPAGGKLFIYTPDLKTVIRPFTDADNEPHKQLWTPILKSDEVVIELSVPTKLASQVKLKLDSVNHGYIEPSISTDKSGSCNLDVVCSAADGFSEVDNWRKEIRSVAAYSINGSMYCSGVLVNNTANDKIPYFLTANHCGIDDNNAASIVVYWNYQNSTCRQPYSAESRQAGDGSLDQFNTGSVELASYTGSDFTLIELDDPIDSNFNVFFAGWDRHDQATQSATAIHHPSVEEKRISFENGPTAVTTYLKTSSPGDGTHIRVTDWDVGTTEPGSSGSPLFSPEGRVIGQLHGGYAACSNDYSDWYGRFYSSWEGGGTSKTRLKDWLDPVNSGVFTLNGINGLSSIMTDIKVNDSYGPLTISASETITATIELFAGDSAGEDADWWVLAKKPSGAWFYYDFNSDKWHPGKVPAKQGPLSDLTPPFKVLNLLNLSNLSTGSYTLYFGVDMLMNGEIDMGEVIYDAVKFTIEP